MKVERIGEYREYRIDLKNSEGENYKARNAVVRLEVEADGNWHHVGTTFRIEKDMFNITLNNIADMVFIGLVAKEIIKIKAELNAPMQMVAKVSGKIEEGDVVKVVSGTKEVKKTKAKSVVHYKVVGHVDTYCGHMVYPHSDIGITTDQSKVTCKKCLKQQKGESNV